jgi:ATP-dependent DNA helicase DinG
MTMIDVLAPGGGLARAIPHYEDRAEQRAMSAAVRRALGEARPLVVEAGTGTGKTLAYLVPALESGLRVVVSTGTRALQDQIARNDVPLLHAIVGRPFTAVVLKGIANYVCLRRLAELRARGPSPVVDALATWAETSATGDRAEVEWLGEDAPVWADATTTPDARVGPRCPCFERCFVTRARRLAERAELVLVNHHLYFADRVLRAASPGARVLPDHDAVVFDEAHQLEDVATEHFGARVSTHRLGQLVRDAQLALARMPLWTGRDAGDAAIAVERAGIALFAQVRGLLVSDGDTRVPLPPALFASGARQTAWFALDSALEELARIAENDADAPPDAPEEGAALPSIARRARALRDDLATIAEQRDTSHVYWGEARATGTTLTASPIEIAALVRRHVVNAGPTPIFTSATLATSGGDFSYARARLGLDDADELVVASPFDYARQALLYVPRDLPDVHDDAFADAAALRVRELLAITNGRAFLLFTSHRALRDAAARLADLPYPRLVQGDAPRATLVERFRATPSAVLLGTASFWEGVDVPGDALSLVVIDKLPFAPHTDPLVAARLAARAAAGADPFEAVQLPSAALALKQGFGRLIRRRDDRGVVAILDHRVVTKRYGRVFVETLPVGLQRTSAIEQVRRWWTDRPKSSQP